MGAVGNTAGEEHRDELPRLNNDGVHPDTAGNQQIAAAVSHPPAAATSDVPVKKKKRKATAEKAGDEQQTAAPAQSEQPAKKAKKGKTADPAVATHQQEAAAEQPSHAAVTAQDTAIDQAAAAEGATQKQRKEQKRAIKKALADSNAAAAAGLEKGTDASGSKAAPPAKTAKAAGLQVHKNQPSSIKEVHSDVPTQATKGAGTAPQTEDASVPAATTAAEAATKAAVNTSGMVAAEVFNDQPAKEEDEPNVEVPQDGDKQPVIEEGDEPSILPLNIAHVTHIHIK